jgi:hypothetical protein
MLAVGRINSCVGARTKAADGASAYPPDEFLGDINKQHSNGEDYMRRLRPATHSKIAALPASALVTVILQTRRRATMVDFVLIVLGTGGILAMAAYAALCERI